jgi:hypothetical protein
MSGDVQDVEIIYRPLGSDGGVDQVIAVRVGDQRLDVSEGSTVQVEHEAGGIGATVRVELIAGRVRYVPDADPQRSGR